MNIQKLSQQEIVTLLRKKGYNLGTIRDILNGEFSLNKINKIIGLSSPSDIRLVANSMP